MLQKLEILAVGLVGLLLLSFQVFNRSGLQFQTTSNMALISFTRNAQYD